MHTLCCLPRPPCTVQTGPRPRCICKTPVCPGVCLADQPYADPGFYRNWHGDKDALCVQSALDPSLTSWYYVNPFVGYTAQNLCGPTDQGGCSNEWACNGGPHIVQPQSENEWNLYQGYGLLYTPFFCGRTALGTRCLMGLPPLID